MTGAQQFAEVDATLLLLAEARERAERAAKAVAAAGGDPSVVSALEATDRDLLALHRRLMDQTVLRTSAEVEAQLALDAA